MPQLLGKDLQVVATANVANTFPADLFLLFQTIILKAVQEYPYDMFVIEHKDGNLQVRLAGYKLPENKRLDEKTVILKVPTSRVFEKLWVKIDDQGDFYSMTILYPSDY